MGGHGELLMMVDERGNMRSIGGSYDSIPETNTATSKSNSDSNSDGPYRLSSIPGLYRPSQRLTVAPGFSSPAPYAPMASSGGDLMSSLNSPFDPPQRLEQQVSDSSSSDSSNGIIPAAAASSAPLTPSSLVLGGGEMLIPLAYGPRNQSQDVADRPENVQNQNQSQKRLHSSRSRTRNRKPQQQQQQQQRQSDAEHDHNDRSHQSRRQRSASAPPPRTAGDVARELYGDDVNMSSPACRLMAEMKAVRIPKQRRTWQGVNTRRRSNVEALLCQITGEESERPCKSCAKGHGPWTRCILVPGFMCGSCANCWFNASGVRCTYHAGGQPQPVPRPSEILSRLQWVLQADPAMSAIGQTLGCCSSLDMRGRYLVRMHAAAEELGLCIAEYEEYIGTPQGALEEERARMEQQQRQHSAAVNTDQETQPYQDTLMPVSETGSDNEDDADGSPE
ncbi:Protein of unknown function (DUF3716) [Geosmithia morbida]|uniref:Uncharacterized protein n=1 Tax=Geosmithia morbida TaxID=1094350 RepID=A0A9P5D654_9HYPO|nr:Protein of unknown function (DUF3716) [Geosmithia morbida]KAF4123154.1 Protein of unknown function (DUF3716) [Geosmithia morbida]